jgi:hypothetical protein
MPVGLGVIEVKKEGAVLTGIEAETKTYAANVFNVNGSFRSDDWTLTNVVRAPERRGRDHGIVVVVLGRWWWS